MVLIEIMANIRVNNEVEDSELIKHFDAKSAEDLAEKMIWMIEHKDCLQAMGDKSFAMCKEKFTIEIIDGQMMSIMEVGQR